MVDCGMVDGKRVRYFFGSRSEAETKAEQLRIEKKNVGLAAFALTDSERAQAAECIELLRPFGKSLRDAVDYYLPHLKSINRSITFERLGQEVVEAKRTDGLSVRYLGDLDQKFKAFNQSFGSRLVASIEALEIDDWLRGLRTHSGARVSAVSRNNLRRVLGVAFSYAVVRQYCDRNPVTSTQKAKEAEKPVGILSPDQLKSLLSVAPPQLVPFIAIGAFAGLRRAELERLDWAEVNLNSGFVEVKASKAKSARRRLVAIRDNLRSWLYPLVESVGLVTPMNYRSLLDTARKKASIPEWPHNALRHSFASYCLAAEKNAAALALDMGHTTPQLIFAHYREVVQESAATRYWNITPDDKSDPAGDVNSD